MITLSEQELNKLKELSCENRQNVIKMVYEAQSGHIGGSLSSCDIMTVLFNKCMKHAVDGKSSPEYQSRDRFVLSKGHVSFSRSFSSFCIYAAPVPLCLLFPVKTALQAECVFFALVECSPAPGTILRRDFLVLGAAVAIGAASRTVLQVIPMQACCALPVLVPMVFQCWIVTDLPDAAVQSLYQHRHGSLHFGTAAGK